MAIRSVTSSEKAQLGGSLLPQPAERPGVQLAVLVSALGRLLCLDRQKVHARSIAGTCQVHRTP
jgi:hypothetical protein